ncbi:DUF6538 domain-containing protein [Nitrosospira multiformis]|uniref:DUF6538 domain-containing protein n=1 Tax=Nitrosospira multiformis TaxID=1231 RepID=UPI00089C7094|nr:DUF6538 domain-containing protein [Nitrosospira multiformis]SEA40822.1 hypothetical protein SAMN05216411_108121 [Nitrosospira multiformis]
MSRKIPYLQGRGDTFSFRIAIPDELQEVIGKREFTKTLETGDKSVAIPGIFMLAVELWQPFGS